MIQSCCPQCLKLHDHPALNTAVEPASGHLLTAKLQWLPVPSPACGSPSFGGGPISMIYAPHFVCMLLPIHPRLFFSSATFASPQR